MLLGGGLAIKQTDLKRILAYSTLSILGALVFLLGIGTKSAIEAAITYLIVHAVYKAALFLVAGIVDHETGIRDVTRLGGLRKAMPLTAVAAGLAALSMAGLPPMFGFIGKELLYEAAERDVHREYVGRLLSLFPPDRVARQPIGDSQLLIEPLSQRELDVLRLLAGGSTNKEVARQLYISLPTVKWHASNIYGKLGVQNRTQAVAKARALGLLSPS